MKLNGFNIDNQNIISFLMGLLVSGLCITLLIILNVLEVNTFGHNSDFNLLFTGFSALSSVVVAISTIVYASLTSSLVNETKRYAGLTSDLVNETKKMRESQIVPVIGIYMKIVKRAFIKVIIENDGMGPAKNIKLTPNIDFIYLEDRKLSELGVFKEGIQYIPPKGKQELFEVYVFQKGRNINEIQEYLSTNINITVKYEDINGKPYEKIIPVNLSELIGQITRDEPIEEIAKNLEKINNILVEINKKL